MSVSNVAFAGFSAAGASACSGFEADSIIRLFGVQPAENISTKKNIKVRADLDTELC